MRKNSIDWITILDENRTDYCACFQYAKWNTNVIAGYKNPEGFIVQKFSRLSVPENLILPDITYYEAWLVEKGICVDTIKYEHDDLFAVTHPMAPLCSFKKSIYKCGEYKFTGEIYWVDKKRNAILFNAVNEWPTDEVEQAGGATCSI